MLVVLNLADVDLMAMQVALARSLVGAFHVSTTKGGTSGLFSVVRGTSGM